MVSVFGVHTCVTLQKVFLHARDSIRHGLRGHACICPTSRFWVVYFFTANLTRTQLLCPPTSSFGFDPIFKDIFDWFSLEMLVQRVIGGVKFAWACKRLIGIHYLR